MHSMSLSISKNNFFPSNLRVILVIMIKLNFLETVVVFHLVRQRTLVYNVFIIYTWMAEWTYRLVFAQSSTKETGQSCKAIK